MNDPCFIANPVRAELVEALPFFERFEEEGQPFDKLRANGVGDSP